MSTMSTSLQRSDNVVSILDFSKIKYFLFIRVKLCIVYLYLQFSQQMENGKRLFPIFLALGTSSLNVLNEIFFFELKMFPC